MLAMPGRTDPLLSRVLYARLCLIVPQVLGESQEKRAVLFELLAAILDRSPAPGSSSPALERAIACGRAQ